jgi:DNA-binding XRE family transcriptional regulator
VSGFLIATSRGVRVVKSHKTNHRLVSLRGERTQETVATAVGISRSHYAKIEGGAIPSLKVAQRIAAYYGVEVGEIWPVRLTQTETCATSELSA